MSGKQVIAQVAFIQLISKILRAVLICTRVGGFDRFLSFYCFNVRVVKRIDINRKTETMSGNRLRIRDKAEIKAGGIVVCHGYFIRDLSYIERIIHSKLL